MGESARSIATKAGAAAMQRAFEAVLPELFQRLDRIDERIAALDREVHGLREQVDAGFDTARDQVSEVGLRVNRLEGRMDEIVRMIGFQNDRLQHQSTKMDQWIERLVRLEMTRTPRRGKRAS